VVDVMVIKNIVSPDFLFYKDFIGYEKGFEAGYKKGVVDMWERKNMWCEFDNENCKECNVNVCPEAQKLLNKIKDNK